ncbi:hypothetical protein FALBO_14865 [Fusarium albosuccineum]|uniref:Uncharacterized protein n=1 Tax=Fusarium albosuccineum TaxID=1237068 RepID=A0A8H4PFA1_9HYPO|nr:hypothetical protein FALBO_14865 [Fusarium albosuccineum]
MCFIIGAAAFVLAFPTFAGSMSGYTTFNDAYVWDGDGYQPFSKAKPIVYKIHNGKRIGLEDDEYHVPFVNGSGSGGPMLKVSGDQYLPGQWCSSWKSDSVKDDCKFQRAVSDYVQRYGFSSSWNETEKLLKDTKWNSTRLLDKEPLKVSGFYIPDHLRFYYNWTDTFKDSAGNGSKASNKELQDKEQFTYDINGQLYNLAKLKKFGSCQPIGEASKITA